MPPKRYSRYEYSLGIRDDQNRLFLTDREPFRYRSLPDNRVHIVKEGETLFSIAGRYFRPWPRACGLWWVIADFQPDDPIIDPTVLLAVGRKLVIPSLQTLNEFVFTEFSGQV